MFWVSKDRRKALIYLLSNFMPLPTGMAHMQYEALGTAQREQAAKTAVRPFKPAFSGRTAAFSPQPAYMACPAARFTHPQVTTIHILMSKWMQS